MCQTRLRGGASHDIMIAAAADARHAAFA